ncbi:hypothetical protein N7537_012116 [Penicillium hordei]|uniref:Uncharacterized protein n=1 Tax=Penicillium hordei TaxID=40994 RepID=A0AAD6GTE2_9EURO|nr:uncharacterized protein N7537_012116 [Penicillium hordei]KAJ5589438.1 hypothetical protein N7537_012116 [Penicillium hordei]
MDVYNELQGRANERKKKRKSHQYRLELATHSSENSIAQTVKTHLDPHLKSSIYNVEEKIGFSLIERVILSAGAMLIFSVYFHLTICPEGRKDILRVQFNLTFWQNYTA